MSIEKAEIKRLTVQDLGKKFETRIEAAKAEFHRLEGAKAGLSHDVLAGIESVKSYWTKDLHDTKISPEIAEAVFKALDQCSGCVRNLITQADFRMQVENGKVQGLEQASKECENIFVEEGRKIATWQEALDKDVVAPEDAGRPPMRTIGEHPGLSIAQQRKEEVAEAPIVMMPEKILPEKIPSKKKPGRKSKTTSAKLFE